ncbi:MAG: hypothetical protein AB7T49_20805 [Oligoflexales bacterium]
MDTMTLAKCGECGSVSKLYTDSNGNPHAWTACCNEKRIPIELEDKDYETLVVLSKSEYQQRLKAIQAG